MLEGWKRTTIATLISEGVIADVQDGNHGNDHPKASDYVANGVPFLMARDLQNGSVNTHSCVFLRREQADALRIGFAKPGDVLLSHKGTVGAVAKVPSGFDYVMLTPQITYYRVGDERRLDPDYLLQFFNGPEFQSRLAQISGQSTRAYIGITEQKRLSIVVPPISEQRKIAEILRTWDEAIEACERLRLKKIEQTTWFRTDLFTGKVRLKGFSNEWRKLPLSAVLTEHGLRSAGSEEVFSVSVHKGLVNQIEHLGRSFAAKETAHYNRVLSGDIVYTKSPTGDFPLGIIKQSKLDHDVIVSPLYGVFTPATRDLGVILDAYFRSPVTVRNYLAPLVQKGAKNTIAITNSRFLEGELTLPLDPAEQRAIAEIIEDADAEIAAIERQMAAYQLQKRGLMQKLLTGEWRVKIDTEVAA